jgi:hypothetical protein
VLLVADQEGTPAFGRRISKKGGVALLQLILSKPISFDYPQYNQ